MLLVTFGTADIMESQAASFECRKGSFLIMVSGRIFGMFQVFHRTLYLLFLQNAAHIFTTISVHTESTVCLELLIRINFFRIHIWLFKSFQTRIPIRIFIVLHSVPYPDPNPDPPDPNVYGPHGSGSASFYP